jgi:hypothetical protein
MSFYTPEFGIKHYNDIPTICSGCGVHATWTDLTQKAKERLIEASSFYSLTAELVLLKRLNDLVIPPLVVGARSGAMLPGPTS